MGSTRGAVSSSSRWLSACANAVRSFSPPCPTGHTLSADVAPASKCAPASARAVSGSPAPPSGAPPSALPGAPTSGRPASPPWCFWRLAAGVFPSMVPSASASATSPPPPATRSSSPRGGCMSSSVLDVSTRLTRNVLSRVHSTASSSGPPLKHSSSAPDCTSASISGDSSKSSTSVWSKHVPYTRLACSPSRRSYARLNQSSDLSPPPAMPAVSGKERRKVRHRVV
mmetsp:Transcript_22393/g.55363  ORF Transcript_22393/g.55363 Transcript_22393/m.55363 type:complete len:227 (-) Transcript_22393:61-741(-)